MIDNPAELVDAVKEMESTDPNIRFCNGQIYRLVASTCQDEGYIMQHSPVKRGKTKFDFEDHIRPIMGSLGRYKHLEMRVNDEWKEYTGYGDNNYYIPCYQSTLLCHINYRDNEIEVISKGNYNEEGIEEITRNAKWLYKIAKNILIEP